MCFVVLFIRATFVFFYVCCLLIVLVKLSILAKLLARMTPLRKPNFGEGDYFHVSEAEECLCLFRFMYCFIV